MYIVSVCYYTWRHFQDYVTRLARLGTPLCSAVPVQAEPCLESSFRTARYSISPSYQEHLPKYRFRGKVLKDAYNSPPLKLQIGIINWTKDLLINYKKVSFQLNLSIFFHDKFLIFICFLSAWNFLFGYVTILLLHVSLLKKSKLSIYTNQKVLTVFDNQL